MTSEWLISASLSNILGLTLTSSILVQPSSSSLPSALQVHQQYYVISRDVAEQKFWIFFLIFQKCLGSFSAPGYFSHQIRNCRTLVFIIKGPLKTYKSFRFRCWRKFQKFFLKQPQFIQGSYIFLVFLKKPFSNSPLKLALTLLPAACGKVMRRVGFSFLGMFVTFRTSPPQRPLSLQGLFYQPRRAWSGDGLECSSSGDV